VKKRRRVCHYRQWDKSGKVVREEWHEVDVRDDEPAKEKPPRKVTRGVQGSLL